jgi:hypothetical protein
VFIFAMLEADSGHKLGREKKKGRKKKKEEERKKEKGSGT